ncbi:MAG: phosphoenolpyruvate carboxykinase [Actinomycetota bacterium]|nr:phosphoenolpyruvate carboxykinase [Actinomycetota bacterium]
MIANKKPYVIAGKKVIMDYARVYCDTPEKLLKSPLFLELADRFVEKMAAKGSALFAFLMDALPQMKRNDLSGYLVNLFRLLSSYSAEEIIAMNRDYEPVLSRRGELHELVEELYNFWRRFERFLYLEAPKRHEATNSEIHGVQFIKSNEDFKNLVLYVYRRVAENITGDTPRVYRQLPSGANMGMLIEHVDWVCPDRYAGLAKIPFIRLSLVNPPVILYPRSNKRKGAFEEIDGISNDMLRLDPAEWFCFPAKVGELTAFIYFHQDFISHALSLSNLFEIASYKDIHEKKPDLIMAFGVQGDGLKSHTVFYEDRENDILTGLVGYCEDVDYFGYFKKMALTLHNIAMLKRGRLPIHGAMVHIKLKDGNEANIVIVGDSGAGKSETIEAFRTLTSEEICDMKIIFDDMGSLGIDGKGRISGYGTEIGAFVRIDDLEAGYAYEEIDRSIFMNPDKTNARLIIPVTRYNHVVKGYPVHFFLYANNYEQIDGDHAAVEVLNSCEGALNVFRSAARLAKGTTDEKGLVHTYFANPFGAPQRRQMHEKEAESYFNQMFRTGVKVGQIRTRLGIEGFEQIGPRAAATGLLKFIRESRI